MTDFWCENQTKNPLLQRDLQDRGIQGRELQDSLIQKVDTCFLQAERYFNKSIVRPNIVFNLRGQSAGQARFYPRQRDKSLIRFNYELMHKYPQEFVQDVAPHESAHIIANSLFGIAIKPHGDEWKFVMSKVLGVNPSVTHQMEVKKAVRRLFLYLCACDQLEHKLTAIRHNRIQRGERQYLCKRCRSALRFVRSCQ